MMIEAYESRSSVAYKNRVTDYSQSIERQVNMCVRERELKKSRERFQKNEMLAQDFERACVRADKLCVSCRRRKSCGLAP